jgi:hypothetical protein
LASTVPCWVWISVLLDITCGDMSAFAAVRFERRPSILGNCLPPADFRLLDAHRFLLAVVDS